jgi:hypothetical protein
MKPSIKASSNLVDRDYIIKSQQGSRSFLMYLSAGSSAGLGADKERVFRFFKGGAMIGIKFVLIVRIFNLIAIGILTDWKTPDRRLRLGEEQLRARIMTALTEPL